MPTRQWRVRGSEVVLGRALPGLMGLIGLAALGGAMAGFVDGRRSDGPSSFLALIAVVAAWLVWKMLRTVWLVTLVEGDKMICLATTKQWSLKLSEITAVRGDAYGLFLVLTTCSQKIWIWAQLDDPAGFLATIRRANPVAEFDRYVER